jgi:hypothetical protein
MGNVVRGLLASVLLAAATASCSGHASHLAQAAELPRDPHTPAALVKIATVFNDEYDGGDYRPVYDRWMRAAR